VYRVDKAMEAGETGVLGKLVGKQAGSFVDGAGLHPSRTRARVAVVNGKRRVERGPYTGGDNQVDIRVVTSSSASAPGVPV
jgi:hypothetical protein